MDIIKNIDIKTCLLNKLPQLCFWGVRGSFPSSLPEHQKLGGATTCLSFTHDDCCVIIDAGTGIIPLGHALKETNHIKDIHIIFTHVHHDHIQGLPFFLPLYAPSINIHFWSHFDLKAILPEWIKPPIFPMGMAQFEANITFHRFDIGDDLLPHKHIKLKSFPLFHPQECSGFAIDFANKKIVTAFDYEPKTKGTHPFLQNHLHDADILIYDTSFFERDYNGYFEGWGHSTWEEALSLQKNYEIETLIGTHHMSFYTDDDIEKYVQDLLNDHDRMPHQQSLIALERMGIRF